MSRIGRRRRCRMVISLTDPFASPLQDRGCQAGRSVIAVAQPRTLPLFGGRTMNTQPAETPAGTQFPRGVELILLPRAHDLGGFEVRRALPAHERQMIGPFIFFDQMGPGEFLAGRGLDVRPHPHIGLATVTYLFDGEIMHRDSLGSVQAIRPGDVNWMTAGSGIAHSERTDQTLRSHANRLFGVQSWGALPKAQEETAGVFVHHPACTLPVGQDGGMRLRLIAGTGWGMTSPVAVSSPLFYADVSLAPDASVALPEEHEEPGVYMVSGSGTNA